MKQALLALFIGLAGTAQATELTPMELEKLRAEYVDPAQRKFCKSQEHRPGWLAVQRGDEHYKTQIGMALYDMERAKKIAAVEVCTCDDRFPSYEPIRDKFLEITEQITSYEEGMAMVSEYRRRAADVFTPAIRQKCIHLRSQE